MRRAEAFFRITASTNDGSKRDTHRVGRVFYPPFRVSYPEQRTSPDVSAGETPVPNVARGNLAKARVAHIRCAG